MGWKQGGQQQQQQRQRQRQRQHKLLLKGGKQAVAEGVTGGGRGVKGAGDGRRQGRGGGGSGDGQWTRYGVGSTVACSELRESHLRYGCIPGASCVFPHVRRLQVGQQLRSIRPLCTVSTLQYALITTCLVPSCPTCRVRHVARVPTVPKSGSSSSSSSSSGRRLGRQAAERGLHQLPLQPGVRAGGCSGSRAGAEARPCVLRPAGQGGAAQAADQALPTAAPAAVPAGAAVLDGRAGEHSFQRAVRRNVRWRLYGGLVRHRRKSRIFGGDGGGRASPGGARRAAVAGWQPGGGGVQAHAAEPHGHPGDLQPQRAAAVPVSTLPCLYSWYGHCGCMPRRCCVSCATHICCSRTCQWTPGHTPTAAPTTVLRPTWMGARGTHSAALKRIVGAGFSGRWQHRALGPLCRLLCMPHGLLFPPPLLLRPTPRHSVQHSERNTASLTHLPHRTIRRPQTGCVDVPWRVALHQRPGAVHHRPAGGGGPLCTVPVYLSLCGALGTRHSKKV